MSNFPPKSPLEILQTIEFEEAVEPTDARFVETEQARGSPGTLKLLAKKFGLSIATQQFLPASKRHVLLFGHIGCGKSTELLHLKHKLSRGRQLYVVAVDVLNELDRNNLRYEDALMALAKGLVQRLESDRVDIQHDAIKGLEAWFTQHIKTDEHASELMAELKTGGNIEFGLPFLTKLFAGFNAAAKTNATYKSTQRTVLRNTFTQFADAFNAFLRGAEHVLQVDNPGQRILFIIDGTDKLNGDDSKRFFIEDAEQLFAIEALVLYTAPLSLKYDGIPLARFDSLVLPIIKLFEADGSLYQAGRMALREILLKRADQAVFADDGLIEELVTYCGGHPRELLRLLKLCCEYAEGSQIDKDAVEGAIKSLAADYRRFLEPDDYALLVEMDRESEQHGGNNKRTQDLLYRLALLEYNDGGWRRSHPVVRRLRGYELAKSQADYKQGST